MLDIAILDGIRTPFAKAYGPLAEVPAQTLGTIAVKRVLRQSEISPEQVDQVIFGNVATPADAANIARVIALQAGIPRDRLAHSVSRNCASGIEALVTAAQQILLGEARVVVAGGVESMSRIPLLFGEEAKDRYLKLGRAKSIWQRLGILLSFRLRHFQPVIAVQQGLTDPVSGLLMGQTAEVLAREFALTRQEQDQYALESHHRASLAQRAGKFADEIVPVETGTGLVSEDVGIRHDQTLEALAKLKPFFEKNGTVTVGNSSMITDGGAAMVVLSGEQARGEGRSPLGYLRGYAMAGCDPARMGLGPVYATSKLLKKLGWTLKEIDLVELNEAFAAVVLANEKAFASRTFAQTELGYEGPVGELRRDRLNVNGGAIALGHPVGATGTRLVLTLLHELRRRGMRRGLATLCVGGGQGAAVAVEVV